MNFFLNQVKNNIVDCLQGISWFFASKQKKQSLLQNVFTLIQLDPEANDLLHQAQADGVKIVLSSGLLFFSEKTMGDFSINEQKIRLNPLAALESIASTLAHELRHYQQYKKLGITSENFHQISRNPRVAFIFNRVAEIDARVFEEKFIRSTNFALLLLKKIQDKVVNQGGNARRITPSDIDTFRQEALLESLAEVPEYRERLPQQVKDGFFSLLKNEKLTNIYDMRAVRYLHSLRTSIISNPHYLDRYKNTSDITVQDIKGLCTMKFSECTENYMADMSVRQFEALVLKTANKDARAAVSLLQEFDTACQKGDKEQAKKIRARVQQRLKIKQRVNKLTSSMG